MAEAQVPSKESSPASVIPQKRALEDDHAPAVSSPLNPDTSSSKGRTTKDKAPIHREPREKKESLKKREAKGTSTAAESRGTPDRSVAGGSKQDLSTDPTPSSAAPLRYKLPPPKPTDFAVPRGPVFSPHHTKAVVGGQDVQFYESSEHVYNRKGFRYTHCIADPAFPSSFYYRQSETEPFTPRINFEDTSSHLLFDEPGTQMTTAKGFRLARANVGVREGRWYWECKITSGIRPPDATNAHKEEPRGHVRVGWARREASLDAPVGFDAYSYGLRDVGGQKMHMSRPKDFFPVSTDINEGDVIGLEISLPSLPLHRKVVEGHYNPAVDLSETSVTDDDTSAPDIIRDRVPIRYKAHLYFEQFEYAPTKDLEDLFNPTISSSSSSHQAPHPTHASVPLRTLPNSSITVYKNGARIGTPFTDLLAFLPPASKPLAQVGARDGLDDGMLGYFPAISVFRGGAAQANFGPHFWFPPPELEDVDMKASSASANPATTTATNVPLRPVSDRYAEQIAEDILYDVIDEVDFWLQDGASTERTHAVGDAAPTVLGPVDPAAPGVEAELTDGVGGGGVGVGVATQAGAEIKEVVQEEE
ncbi:MAG: hypothetical protein M1833_001225 [Piccolia ochrophora]|nr:MAG: hypothetical protein M1833_001225 [Piccolia ochrophora]